MCDAKVQGRSLNRYSGEWTVRQTWSAADSWLPSAMHIWSGPCPRPSPDSRHPCPSTAFVNGTYRSVELLEVARICQLDWKTQIASSQLPTPEADRLPNIIYCHMTTVISSQGWRGEGFPGVVKLGPEPLSWYDYKGMAHELMKYLYVSNKCPGFP